jgi:outer membrane protein OmpA-like peptidoglycan-associated protein
MSDPSDTSSTKKRLLAWVVGVLAVPPLLAALTSVVNRTSIENDLTNRTETALADAGYDDVTVEYQGRDATVTTSDASADAGAIRAAVRGVDGNRVVHVTTDGADGSPPFSVAAQGGDLVVTATAPDETSKMALLDAVRANAGGRNVVDKVTVTAGAKAPDATAIGEFAGALGAAPGDRSIAVDGDTVTLTGSVPSGEARAEAERAATAAQPGTKVNNQLMIAPADSPSPVPDPAATQAAQAEINRVLAGSTVNFSPDSASLTPQGTAAVQRVAAVLQKYPTVRAEVRGHVANTGNANVDLRLSQARASAVVAVLRRFGVDGGRLAPRGLGSTQPVTTDPAQSSRNRRVEFAIIGGTK